MSIPDRDKSSPSTPILGALLCLRGSAGRARKCRVLPYLRLAMPTSRFLPTTPLAPICALKPNLGDFIVAIGDDEWQDLPRRHEGFRFVSRDDCSTMEAV